MIRVRVTAAVLSNNGRILLAQRSENQSRPLRWEFPGGKVEAGEDDRGCLVRELAEELAIEVRIGARLGVYPYDYGDVNIELAVYYASLLAGIPRALEHRAVCWVEPDKLLSYDLAAADIPVAKALVQELSQGMNKRMHCYIREFGQQ